MPSSFSPSLRLELIAPGEQAGTWGTTTNTNLGTLVESSIAGYQTISVIAADQALTIADGAADQSRSAMLRLTTTTGAPFNVYAPPVTKQYLIVNDSVHAATIFNSTVPGNTTAAGTGVTIPAGKSMAVFTNGTNFRTIDAAALLTTLPIANGGTGATTASAARTNLGTVNDPGTNGILVRTAANTTTPRSVAVSGEGLSVTNGDGVAGNPTITSNATNANTPSTIVARNASGNFSAGTITADLTGNASTATTLQTARTINGVSFNGSANITVTANTPNTLTRGTYLTGANFNGSAATTWAVDATSTNTADKVVARDSSGNFSAGTITATLIGNLIGNVTGNVTGNASTATTLQTARTINGVSFNGGADITLSTVNLSGDQTIGGLKTFSSDVTGARFLPTANSPSGTGMYALSTNTLAFSTGGTTRAALLDEAGSTTLVVGPGLSLPVSSGAVIRATNGSGTNVAGSQLVLRGGTSTGAALGGSIVFSTSPPGSFGSSSNEPVERVRINAFGDVGIGQINPTTRLWVEGSSTNDNFGVFQARNTSTTNAACAASFVVGSSSTSTDNALVKFAIGGFTAQSGQINANGANQAAFGTFSDQRLKENIVDLPSQLENICALRPVEFDYIESEGGGHQIGFIAQEMQEVYPAAVGERDDGMLTVTGWDKTTACLVSAIKELKAELDKVKDELRALKGS